MTPGEIHPRVELAGFRSPPPGFRIGPRRNNHPELVYVAQGMMVYEAEHARPLEVRRERVLFIPPGVRHVLRRGAGGGELTAGYIHCEPLPGARWRDGGYRLRPEPRRLTAIDGDTTLPGLFRRAHEAFHGYGAFRREILSTVVREIWLRLCEYWTGAGGPRLSPRMREMVAFLRANLTLPVGRRELAARFHVTPEHVNYLFKRELGVSPGAFLQRERAIRAHRLLSEERLSVKEVAARLGYDDPYHFSRVFKRVMGMPPSLAR